MATKGAVKIKNTYYYISSDAYPSFAKKILLKAVKISKTPREFITNANKLAGHKWIAGRVSKKWLNTPFCEHIYEVNLRTKSVRKLRTIYKPKFNF